MASAKAEKQIGELNVQKLKNEQAIIARNTRAKEAALRKESDRLVGKQRVAVAKSGVQMTGSTLVALRDTFFNTQMDAIGIRYAGSVEESGKLFDQAVTRASSNARATAYKTAAYRTVLQSGEKAFKVGMG
tara:strand:- start:169 stop:561 length:393 start_codon:yes stop_codon:yes gene_type:complete